jgi:hypothetical protein
VEWRITPSAFALRATADKSANPPYACFAEFTKADDENNGKAPKSLGLAK